MKKSQLQSIANKTGKDIDLSKLRKQRHRSVKVSKTKTSICQSFENKDIDLSKLRKQRNLVVNLNKKEKNKFLNSLSIEYDSKPF